MNSKSSIISEDSSNIIFITGGTKSGKSEFAEHLAKEVRNLSYVALSENNKQDKLWQEKISLHQKRRPKDWETIETTDLLNTLNNEDGPLLIDSIGGFVMESIDRENKECLIYESRPHFCRVNEFSTTFKEYLKSGDKFLIDCCKQHISSNYGYKSKEMKSFKVAISGK